MDPRFVDTNVFLRYLSRDDETMAERALDLLARIERGEERAQTLPTVVFETVYTLQSFYGVPRSTIRELLSPILELRGLRIAGKELLFEALDLYVDRPRLSFADAYHAAYVRRSDPSEIYSWDTDFDRVPGISRIEP